MPLRTWITRARANRALGALLILFGAAIPMGMVPFPIVGFLGLAIGPGLLVYHGYRLLRNAKS